jgi:hypothetical protein
MNNARYRRQQNAIMNRATVRDVRKVQTKRKADNRGQAGALLLLSLFAIVAFATIAIAGA